MTDSIRDVPVFKLYGAPSNGRPRTCCTASRSPPAVVCTTGRSSRTGTPISLSCSTCARAGRSQVEGEPTRVEQPSIQFVPPLCIHGFQFSGAHRRLRADACRTVAGAPAGRTSARSARRWRRRGCTRWARTGAISTRCSDAIDGEYAGAAPARELLLQSLIGVLAVWLGRQVMVRRAEARPGRSQEYLSAFSQLVERHFREHLGIDEYARRLGISPAHLNSVARRLSGQTALGIVHQRLLLEAKRDLV